MNKKITGFCAAFLIQVTASMFVLFLSPSLLSQELVAPIEEMVTTGERSLRTMRNQVISAENDLYEAFNEVYADTDYEMICRFEKPMKDPTDPTLNAWQVRACRSKLAHELYDRAMSEHAEFISDESQGITGIEVNINAYERDTKTHGEDLNQKALALLTEDPDYLEKYLRHAQLKKEYDEAVKADNEKGNFFTRLFGR